MEISLDNPQPSDFPVINKNTILENFNDFVTDQEITLEKIQEYLALRGGPRRFTRGST